MAKKKTDWRPAFWISGNYYDSRKKWAEFASSGCNIEVIECGHNSEDTPSHLRVGQANDVIMSLKNDDIFDTRQRVIKMVGLPPDYTQIADYLSLCDDKNALVIVGPIGYYTSAGKGSRFNSATASNFYKKIDGWGNVFSFPEVAKTAEEAQAWVKSVLNDLGQKMDTDAVALLVESRGKNLDTLYGDITRLNDYSMGKNITKEDVAQVCIPLFTRTTWDFIDALDDQNLETCLSHLHNFFGIAGSEVGHNFYGDIFAFLAALEQHYTFLMLVKSHGLGKNTSFDTAVDAIRNLKKREKKDDKETWEGDQFSYGFVKMAYSKPRILNALKWRSSKLHEIVLHIYRTSNFCRYYSSDEEMIKVALDQFVLHACDQISLERATKNRGKIKGLFV